MQDLDTKPDDLKLIPGPNKREAVSLTLRWSHSQRTKSQVWSTFHKSPSVASLWPACYRTYVKFTQSK